MADATDFLSKARQNTMTEPVKQSNPAEDFRSDFTVGRAGEMTGRVIDTAASLPGKAFSVVNEGAIKPARGVLSEFGKGVARGAGVEGFTTSAQANSGAQLAPENAFQGGQGHSGRRNAASDVSGFLTDEKTFRNAQYDPMSGNPMDFVNRVQGGDTRASTEGFTAGSTRVDGAPNAFSNVQGFMKGEQPYDASQMKGGTVNTMSAEAFVNPGGKAAGDAAAGQAKRDFQLRQEGNAHLASDATPDEKTAARMDEIQRELNTINLGTNQSFTELANNKARARRLEQEMAAIQGGQAASAERGFEAQQNALDRRSQERIEKIKNLPGMGDLKIGSTKERTLNELVTNPRGWASLSPEKQWILGKGVRENVIKNWDPVWGDMTPEKVTEKADLIIGQLKQAASQSSQAADQSADKLASTGQVPPMEGARQASDGNWYIQKDGKLHLIEQ